MTQPMLWVGRYPWSDTTPLAEKISVERRMGTKTYYHFCGKPI